MVSIFALLALILILLKYRVAEGPLSYFAVKFNFLRGGADGKNYDAMLSARLSALESENRALKEALGENASGEVPAEIRLGGGYLFSDILLLNKGDGDGLSIGDIVLSKEKIFVGKISDTGRNWSKVNPIGRLGEKIALRAGINKEITFEAAGLGRGELFVELPKDLGLAVGDIVWLGEEASYPAGLISAIRKNEGREMQDVTISSPLPLGSLAEVIAVKNR